MEEQDNARLMTEISRLREELAQKEDEIRKLQVANLFLETLFDGIDEEILVISPEYTVLDANRVFLEKYGLRKEQVRGKKCYEIVYQLSYPCRDERNLCPLERAKKTKAKVEMTHCHGKGEQVKEFMRIMYPLFSKGDYPDCFIEISRDVTDYRNLIRKLQASEKKFRAILDTANDAILSVDSNNRIILFNNAAERIFGYKREEVLGRSLNLLVPPQYGDHYRHVKRFLETRSAKVVGKTLSLTALRKNGEEFPIELGISYFEMGGSVTFTAIIRDVSAQRQLEKKLLRSERLAAVGQAVAHVAHEIRNPLMIIGGFSHQLRRSLTDEKALQKLDMIFDEVRRLEKLVRNLGDFTKEYKLVKRPADLNAVIRDVLKIMGEIYLRKRYTFREDLADDLGEVYCDPDKLKQVFMNVIANGIEAMENGGMILVSTAKVKNGVEIRIKDEGVGIEESRLLHIFEPFYTTRERGSGLGLAISYRIIEAHRGDIWAESQPGQGTTFVIRLPER
ncbi:MAG: PAS domain S-box protein [Deltaproteobacteria bacterium]|nr:PAS domain S-box protein [Deltaproteobacteria bacterium]MBW1930387.1 PAS domain S-box protein [Deltaproteobacteria bacterium]MBW2126343.1 PAS domain S-box protein [Deltaproteobacteria bacterium]